MNVWTRGSLRGVVATLLLVPACLAQCHFQASRQQAEVTYRFNAERTPYGLTLHVTLETYPEPNGRLVLVVPGAWAGEKVKGVTNLHAVTAGATMTAGEDAGTTVVQAAAGKPVVVGYDLVKDWIGPLVHPKQFHPVLYPDYFEFTGSNGLVRPQFAGSEGGAAHFDWQRMPEGWSLATSFGSSAAASGARGRCQMVTGPWHDVWNGLYAAGDFRLRRFAIDGQPAVLAIRGTWNFSDEEAMSELQRVIGAVRSFWHDDHFPYFLVTLKPYDQDKGGWDGSAFTHAFWMYLSRQEGLDGLLPTLAHETFHEWNPLRMGTMSSQADRETEWFHEGFTNYYGNLLLVRAGVMTPAQYMKALNEMLLKFPKTSNAYVRGWGVALWLDGAIRSDTSGKHTLDDVMFDLVRGRAQPLTQDRIYQTMDAYLSVEDQKRLRGAVMEHADLQPPAKAPSVGECWRPEQKEFAGYELGFDLNGSKAGRILVGVTESGPAYAAGLRNGQTLKGWSVVSEPDRLAKITVGAEAGDRVVEFYPRGKSAPVWQYGACVR